MQSPQHETTRTVLPIRTSAHDTSRSPEPTRHGAAQYQSFSTLASPVDTPKSSRPHSPSSALLSISYPPSHSSRPSEATAPELGGHQNEYLSIRSEEHTSELQSLMRISYAVFCLKTKHIPQIVEPLDRQRTPL